MSAVPEKDRDRARQVLHALGSHPRTTTDHGNVIDLPQPVLAALVEAGRLPARMVGTHRRLALGEVLAHREASARSAEQRSMR